MNKLIKSAMMMASVGAMLCIVGCGKEAAKLTPQEEMLAMFQSVNDECAKLGAKPLVDTESIAKAKTLTQEQATAELAKLKPMFALFTEYAAALAEVNEMFKKATGTPYFKDGSEAYARLEDFTHGDDAKRKEKLNALKMSKEKGQAFFKLVAELNDLLKKTGGSRYDDYKIKSFFSDSEEDQNREIDSLKKLIQRLKNR